MRRFILRAFESLRTRFFPFPAFLCFRSLPSGRGKESFDSGLGGPHSPALCPIRGRRLKAGAGIAQSVERHVVVVEVGRSIRPTRPVRGFFTQTC